MSNNFHSAVVDIGTTKASSMTSTDGQPVMRLRAQAFSSELRDSIINHATLLGIDPTCTSKVSIEPGKAHLYITQHKPRHIYKGPLKQSKQMEERLVKWTRFISFNTKICTLLNLQIMRSNQKMLQDKDGRYWIRMRHLSLVDPKQWKCKNLSVGDKTLNVATLISMGMADYFKLKAGEIIDALLGNLVFDLILRYLFGFGGSVTKDLLLYKNPSNNKTYMAFTGHPGLRIIDEAEDLTKRNIVNILAPNEDHKYQKSIKEFFLGVQKVACKRNLAWVRQQWMQTNTFLAGPGSEYMEFIDASRLVSINKIFLPDSNSDEPDLDFGLDFSDTPNDYSASPDKTSEIQPLNANGTTKQPSPPMSLGPNDCKDVSNGGSSHQCPSTGRQSKQYAEQLPSTEQVLGSPKRSLLLGQKREREEDQSDEKQSDNDTATTDSGTGTEKARVCGVTENKGSAVSKSSQLASSSSTPKAKKAKQNVNDEVQQTNTQHRDHCNHKQEWPHKALHLASFDKFLYHASVTNQCSKSDGCISARAIWQSYMSYLFISKVAREQSKQLTKGLFTRCAAVRFCIRKPHNLIAFECSPASIDLTIGQQTKVDPM